MDNTQDDAAIIAMMEADFKGSELSEFMDDVTFEQFHTLRERIEDYGNLLQGKKGLAEYFDGEGKRIDVFLSSLIETLTFARAERKKYADEYSAVRRDMIADEKKLESLSREYARLVAELEARKRLRNERAEIDLMTKDHPWRKIALPHQYEGAFRLSGTRRGILGDHPGLGKTLQAIMTIDMLRATGLTKKVLIFCPKPVLDGFNTEFARRSPGQFVQILNQTKKGQKNMVLDVIKLMPECVVLTNYEVWRKDRSLIDELIACQFDTVVLDEAHKLKNAKSATAKGILEIVHAENQCFNCGMLTFGSGCGACGKYPTELFQNQSVKNVFPMTGTPILNKPQDLFTLLHIIDPIGFPDETAFLFDFCLKVCGGCRARTHTFCECVDGPRWRWTFRDGGEAALLNKLGMRFTARTRDSAGVKMPPQEIKHWNLTLEDYDRQAKFISDLRDAARIEFSDGGAVTQLEVFAWYMRMRQSAEWPDGVVIRDNRKDPHTGEKIGTGEIIWPKSEKDLPGESAIMDWAEERITEGVENGNRLVVFSHFKKSLVELSRRLEMAKISHVRYDGDLSDAAKIEAQRDFDLTVTRPENSKFQVILVQYDSGKVGLNLHGAHEVVFMGREWNPGMEKQAMERVRRIGSEFETMVHIPHCAGTATELIDAILEDKEKIVDGFDSEVNLAEQIKKFLKGDK